MKKWMGMAAVLVAAALTIGGCGKSEYEYIAAEGVGELPESPKQEPPEIVLEEASAKEDVIVLEQDGVEGEKTEEAKTEATKADEMKDEMKTDGSISLLFGGDVLLSDHVLNAYQRSGGIGGVVDAGYRQVMEEADFLWSIRSFRSAAGGLRRRINSIRSASRRKKFPCFRNWGLMR